MLRGSLGKTDRKHRCHSNALGLQVPPTAHILSIFSSKAPKRLSDHSTDSRGWRAAEAGGTPEVPECMASVSMHTLAL